MTNPNSKSLSNADIRIDSPDVTVVLDDAALFAIDASTIATIGRNRQVLQAQRCVEFIGAAANHAITLVEITQLAEAASGFDLEGDRDVLTANPAVVREGQAPRVEIIGSEQIASDLAAEGFRRVLHPDTFSVFSTAVAAHLVEPWVPFVVVVSRGRR